MCFGHLGSASMCSLRYADLPYTILNLAKKRFFKIKKHSKNMVLDNSSQKGQLPSYTSSYENILKLDIFYKLKWRKIIFIL